MKRLLTSILMLLSVMVMQAQQVVHTVQRGETLESIAEKYHVTKETITQNNPNAADAFYVGLKLYIPTAQSENVPQSVDQSQSETIQEPTPSYGNNEYSQNQQSESPYSNSTPNPSSISMPQRKKVTFELGYNASSFKDVKLSGSYGFSVTALPLEITDNLYFGVHFSPFNFNWGLVDSDLASDLIKLGPALGYYFTPTIFVSLPVVAMCDIYFKGKETKTAWGMSWAPTLYVGNNKIGLFAGLMFSLPFQGESKINTGFRAGIYF